MGTTVGIGIAALLAVSLAAPAVAGRGEAAERRYSGAVAMVDRAAGTIVVEGMGPWRVKDGVTQVERRTIAVTASTALMGIKRASGVAPSGWMGDYVESALPAWQVKPGDWVTVILEPDGGRPTASRIDVVEPGELR
jgi:hypothetical protein